MENQRTLHNIYTMEELNQRKPPKARQELINNIYKALDKYETANEQEARNLKNQFIELSNQYYFIFAFNTKGNPAIYQCKDYRTYKNELAELNKVMKEKKIIDIIKYTNRIQKELQELKPTH